MNVFKLRPVKLGGCKGEDESMFETGKEEVFIVPVSGTGSDGKGLRWAQMERSWRIEMILL